jgi:hypothetical protein
MSRIIIGTSGFRVGYVPIVTPRIHPAADEPAVFQARHPTRSRCRSALCTFGRTRLCT